MKKINDFALKALSGQLSIKGEVKLEKTEFRGVMLGRELFCYLLKTMYKKIPIYYIYMSYKDEKIDMEELISGFECSVIELEKLLKTKVSDDHYEYIRKNSRRYFGIKFEDMQGEYPEETMDCMKQKIQDIIKETGSDFAKILPLFINTFDLKVLENNIKTKYETLNC